ncbi:MAG TPA: dihydrofolate reductase family protein, partial [Thermoplasmata archaeon]|nr:dihydrofolate reductase family protein [Thermoplasmata archaeon]
MPDRPFVWANCAMSLDGRLAYAGGRRARLSGPEDLRRVHALRADCQAIIVGVGTVRADDPSLRVKWELLDRPPGPGPLRVVLDSRGTVPPGAKVLDGSQPTLIATVAGAPTAFPPSVETFGAGTDRVDLPMLLGELHRRGHRRVLVEGG